MNVNVIQKQKLSCHPAEVDLPRHPAVFQLRGPLRTSPAQLSCPLIKTAQRWRVQRVQRTAAVGQCVDAWSDILQTFLSQLLQGKAWPGGASSLAESPRSRRLRFPVVFCLDQHCGRKDIGDVLIWHNIYHQHTKLQCVTSVTFHFLSHSRFLHPFAYWIFLICLCHHLHYSDAKEQ